MKSEAIGGTAATYDARDLASQLKCSVRHIWRLRDAHLLPPPLRIGSSRLVRWSAEAIDEWIRAGCRPQVRRGRA
jgi:predicted DNA-binding transcriptional regulator AlpA